MLVNRDAESPSTPVVAADYRTALIELLDLLYGFGHRSMVYLAGSPHSASNTRRLAAVPTFSMIMPTLRSGPLHAGSASATVVKPRSVSSPLRLPRCSLSTTWSQWA